MCASVRCSLTTMTHQIKDITLTMLRAGDFDQHDAEAVRCELLRAAAELRRVTAQPDQLNSVASKA